MGVLSAFLAETILIAYRGLAGKTQVQAVPYLPLPADFTSAIIIYGALGFLADTQVAPVATVVGWGFVVATLLKLWTPKSPTHVTTAPAPTPAPKAKVAAA